MFCKPLYLIPLILSPVVIVQGHSADLFTSPISSAPPLVVLRKKMGLKRKIARYIKIIWVSTKSETVFLYPAYMERCSKTIKSWRKRKRRKGKKYFRNFKLWKT